MGVGEMYSAPLVKEFVSQTKTVFVSEMHSLTFCGIDIGCVK